MTTKAFAQLPRLRSHYNDCSRRAFDERALLFGVVAHEGNLEEWNSPALCPPGTGPTRLRQEGWLQNRGGLEGNRLRGKARARLTQEGSGFGAGPQVRRDPRHRTEQLGPLGP